MPREYKRQRGGRVYGNYTAEVLEEALMLIQSNVLSQRQAEKKYRIPRSTLKNKLARRFTKDPGGQMALSEEEEENFVSQVVTLSEYGFPIDRLDLRCLVKSYLDMKGVKHARFCNNMPGVEWARSFVKRHFVLTERFAQNIKKSRASISPTILNSYYDNLQVTLDGVPPENVWNYDETNLSDDPGRKKVICKRGMKYPERIMNSSKASTSVMYCGNAHGEILPPYVVYKSEHLWDTWTTGGPKGARYNRTKSGWFDITCFEDWFESLLLPRLKRQEGTKVCIGDNLSSHFTPRVLDLCKTNNIRCVALPPNSTHLTQPLDVAYFRAMKGAWRKILEEYKQKNLGNRGAGIVSKGDFPAILQKLTTTLVTSDTASLRNGFRKTGIIPCNRQEVIGRLPNGTTSADVSPLVNTAVLGFLTEKHYGPENTENTTKPTRKKRVHVHPGKSIQSEDVEIVNRKRTLDEASTSGRIIIQKKRQRALFTASSEEDDPEPDPEPLVSDDDHEEEHGNSHKASEFKTNCYVIVDYEGELFPGIVTDVKSGGDRIEVSTMAMCGIGMWKWPDKTDKIWYGAEEVKLKIGAPTLVNRGGQYTVPEIINLKNKKM